MSAVKSDSCPFCRELRPLGKHLYELALFCCYLGNSVKYRNQTVHSSVIGKWLKLASQLVKVEIDTFPFSGDSDLYCGAAADREASDSMHFTIYSTALTRFIFVSNALEETYRFVEPHYLQKSTGKSTCGKRSHSASTKAAALIDASSGSEAPKHFQHLVNNYSSIYNVYRKRYDPYMSGMENTSLEARSYALHLVRNLRNHVAHGAFPLIENPEYWGVDGERDFAVNLLGHSCRLSALYVQLLMRDFNNGFQSYDYQIIDGASGVEYDRFLNNCTDKYGGILHLTGDFGLSDALI